MNTTEKGDTFEKKALKIIKQALEDGELGLSRKHVRIFSKKGYYSKDREDEIVFDLTLEVWPPHANKYTLIYIIECKDYISSIPVSDLEEFYSKIIQVSGANAKGVFMANNDFQEGAIKYANSKGIMLIQGESRRNYEILLHKNSRQNDNSLISKNNESLQPENFDVKFIEKQIDKIIHNAFKKSLDQNSQTNDYNISRLSKKQIELKAEFELNKIDPDILLKGFTPTLAKLNKYTSEELGVTIRVLPSNSNLLGTCDTLNKTICIHPSLISTRRYLFILAHEIAHFVLHKDLEIEQEKYESFTDSEFNFATDQYELNNPKHWIEWQANYFASCLILPEVPFRTRLYWYQQHNNTRDGVIYLDDQIGNINNYIKLLEQLSYYFDVTKTSINYRLTELELINNKSRLKPIREIINEYKDDLVIK